MMPGCARSAARAGRRNGPLYQLFRLTAKRADVRMKATSSLIRQSAGRLAALLANFADVLGELIVEIVGSARDHAVADEIERRALQPELLCQLLGLVERPLHLWIGHVLLELGGIEPELTGDTQRLLLVGLAGLGEQLLVHLEIFALLVSGKRGL